MEIKEPWYYYAKTAFCIPQLKRCTFVPIRSTRVQYFRSEWHSYNYHTGHYRDSQLFHLNITCVFMLTRAKWLEFHSSAVLDRAWASFPCRLKRFVMAGSLRKAHPEPKSMVLCRADTCRARPPAPEVINMHLQPPRPSHCRLPRPHILAPLPPLGTCYSSATLRGL